MRKLRFRALGFAFAILALIGFAVRGALIDAFVGEVSDAELALALRSTWNVVTNLAPEKDPVPLQRDIEGALGLLYPNLAARLRANQPGVHQTEEDSLMTITNPGLVDSRVSADPDLRRQRDASFAKVYQFTVRPVTTE